MKENHIEIYNKKISERLSLILKYANLEIKGIAALTNRSPDIFYAVLNGRRPLSRDLASLIGKSLDFDGSIIFNINVPVPISIKQSKVLESFRVANSNNTSFFIDTWSYNKDSSFIREHLINKGYFTEPRYAWEVREKLLSLGRKINSDLLTKQLKYLAEKGILKSQKAPLKLKNSSYGNRKVTVYFH